MTTDTPSGNNPVLLPCPFCAGRLVHTESMAKSFNPPRLYHEYLHDCEEWCVFHHRRWNFADDEHSMTNGQSRHDFIAKWNTRTPPKTHDQSDASRNSSAKMCELKEEALYQLAKEDLRPADVIDWLCEKILATLSPPALAMRDDIYKSGDEISEMIFQKYVKAKPLEAMPWRDMRDRIIVELQKAYCLGQASLSPPALAMRSAAQTLLDACIKDYGEPEREGDYPDEGSVGWNGDGKGTAVTFLMMKNLQNALSISSPVSGDVNDDWEEEHLDNDVAVSQDKADGEDEKQWADRLGYEILALLEANPKDQMPSIISDQIMIYFRRILARQKQTTAVDLEKLAKETADDIADCETLNPPYDWLKMKIENALRQAAGWTR